MATPSRITAAESEPRKYPAEQPRYPELARAVRAAWRDTQVEFRLLRREWFRILGTPDPDPTQANEAPGQRLTDAQQRALDEAIERFLAAFAGDDRSRPGFTEPAAGLEERILQAAEFLAHRVGQRRAVQLVPGARSEVFTASQRRRLLEQAFDRMSEGSKLRFETRLIEIRDEMVTAYNEGESPLTVARRLSQRLTGYEQGNLQRIVRTEMGLASEGAIQGTFRANGVERVEVIGDPNTDPACTSRIGKTFPLGDAGNLPVFHPNCFCSIVAALD